jgi:cyclic-di-GMP-binding biofilm dispersal mediator protein
VAGATGGLGAALTRALAARGASVVAFVRDRAKVAALALPVAEVVEGDLRTSADCARAVAVAGSLDGLVNAAGVVAFGPLAETDDDTLELVFATNVLGPLRLLRAAIPALAEGGFVVNLSAVVAEAPVANMATYSASKAALTAADVAVQRELRRQRITVIDVRPPHTETGLAARPVAGTAPALPEGLRPEVVAARIVIAVEADERVLPSTAFSG